LKPTSKFRRRSAAKKFVISGRRRAAFFFPVTQPLLPPSGELVDSEV
jgi:hypothetical protein